MSTQTTDTKPQPAASGRLSGAAIIDAVKRAGIEFVLAVPDISTSEGLLWPISRDPQLRLVRVCKEDETFGISAGLSYTNRRSLMLFQNTGLLDSINALRSVGMEFNLPNCMMVGLLNRTVGRPADKQPYGIRIVEPVLDAMSVHHVMVETDADIGKIGPAIERCYATPEPVAILIGQMPEWETAS